MEHLISVIMGIYNCADTLPEAIDSILGQTYQNWELILCDDCSTDNTYAVAESYRDQYPDKIKLIRNDRNSKLAYSLNHCLQYAEGEFVARMDGDDLSKPERFEKQLAFLQAHPEVDLVGTAMQRFDEKGLGTVIEKPEKPDKYTLRRSIPFNHATILTYKRVYDALKGYTVSDRTVRAQDYDLWFRFYHAGFTGANLRETLYLVREDGAAYKRRTIKVRWVTLQTTYMGFRLLGFPKRWLIRPTVEAVVKSMIPSGFVRRYHQIQRK